jgi:hypothetical protein
MAKKYERQENRLKTLIEKFIKMSEEISDIQVKNKNLRE